jgi:RNA polymerase sigma factor (sigma-70 family)
MGAGPEFYTTRWSVVRAAQGHDPAATAALEDLCKEYWFPLYAFVRRSGVAAVEAEDVVQAFFARLIERRDLDQLSPEKGRFRSFLRVAIRNFLQNHRAHEAALKRGGGRVVLEADFAQADQRLDAESNRDADPELAFEQAWARELLRSAVADLEREYKESGRARIFEELKVELQRTGEGECQAHAERLGLSVGACRVAIHRLRARFREALQARIQSTLAPGESWEAELGALLRVLGG